MPSVLIVDDSKDTRWELKRYFKDLSWEVSAEAENGLEAIDAYIRLRPDLVSLDLIMPVLDGLSALQEIKKFDSSAVIMIVSASINQRVIHKANSWGVDLFVLKPVTLEKLKNVLKIPFPPQSSGQFLGKVSGARRG